MKRLIATICILLIMMMSLAGCKKAPAYDHFNYEVSDYVTLGEFIGIEYSYVEPIVTEDDVTAYINDLLSKKGYGEKVEITDRPIQKGDSVNIDYEGKIDGVAFEGGTGNEPALVIGSNAFIPGFEDGLIGVNSGETVDLNLTFPENYGSAELAGQDAVFTVTVNSIKVTEYPELTDEIAAEISDSETVEALNEYANSMVYAQKQAESDNLRDNEIWSKVLSKCEFKKLPQKEVDRHKDSIIKSQENIAAQYGMSFDEYLAQAGVTYEQLEPTIIEQAELQTKYVLVAVAICRDQDIDYTKEEYKAELDKAAASYGYSSTDDFLEAITDEELFYHDLILNKAVDYVAENAVEKAK